MKRTVQRPWGMRKKGGWIIRNDALLKALKVGEVVDFGGVTVGTKQLCQLLQLMPYPDSLIKANGRLEVETVQLFFRRGKDGQKRGSYRKPRRNYSWFSLLKGAWVPTRINTVVVLRPKRYG